MKEERQTGEKNRKLEKRRNDNSQSIREETMKTERKRAIDDERRNEEIMIKEAGTTQQIKGKEEK